jgi:hypothetical protein
MNLQRRSEAGFGGALNQAWALPALSILPVPPGGAIIRVPQDTAAEGAP